MADRWLGIDVGTQGARATVVDASGTVLAAGSHPLTSRRGGVRHEQDPGAWRGAVAAACRQATADGLPVAAVAVCATSGTIAVLDADGEPRIAGLMYDDGRARDEVAAVLEAGIGYRMQASWALPKLLWLLRRQTSGMLAHQSDVITWWLAGHRTPTDWSHALKTGYDPAGGWPYEVLDRLGVPAGMLPEVVAPGTVLGTVCAAAAGATGLPAGIPIVAGMTDGCAAQLAAGAVEPGDWNCVLGTTLVFKGATEHRITDPYGVVYSHRAPDGTWLPGGASSVGAGVIPELFGGADLDALAAHAAAYEPSGMLAYPLVSRGERFPFAAPDARRIELGEPAGDADRYAGILQGVGYCERLAFDHLDLLGMPVRRVTLTGGGTRSRYWCQLQADICDRPVLLARHSDAAFGMAVLAATRGDRAGIAAMVGDPEEIRPRAGRERFRAPYRRLVAVLADRGWLPASLAAHATGRATP
jgi:D-ribulokinase